jgi:hypothetical protein
MDCRVSFGEKHGFSFSFPTDFQPSAAWVEGFFRCVLMGGRPGRGAVRTLARRGPPRSRLSCIPEIRCAEIPPETGASFQEPKTRRGRRAFIPLTAPSKRPPQSLLSFFREKSRLERRKDFV